MCDISPLNCFQHRRKSAGFVPADNLRRLRIYLERTIGGIIMPSPSMATFVQIKNPIGNVLWSSFYEKHRICMYRVSNVSLTPFVIFCGACCCLHLLVGWRKYARRDRRFVTTKLRTLLSQAEFRPKRNTGQILHGTSLELAYGFVLMTSFPWGYDHFISVIIAYTVASLRHGW